MSGRLGWTDLRRSRRSSCVGAGRRTVVAVSERGDARQPQQPERLGILLGRHGRVERALDRSGLRGRLRADDHAAVGPLDALVQVLLQRRRHRALARVAAKAGRERVARGILEGRAAGRHLEEPVVARAGPARQLLQVARRRRAGRTGAAHRQAALEVEARARPQRQHEHHEHGAAGAHDERDRVADAELRAPLRDGRLDAGQAARGGRRLGQPAALAARALGRGRRAVAKRAGRHVLEGVWLWWWRLHGSIARHSCLRSLDIVPCVYLSPEVASAVEGQRTTCKLAVLALKGEH